MSIVEDPKNGGLWFATQRGLLYIKEEENYHKIFSLYDGIPGYIFNSPVQITDDNTVWWGNERGLVCYDAVKSWSEIGTKGPASRDYFHFSRRQTFVPGRDINARFCSIYR